MALLAAADGGFFASSWLPAGLGFATAALLVLQRHERPLLRRATIAFLAGFGAIACWTTASATWSIVPDASLREGARSALYVIAAAAFAVAGRGLVRGLVAAATLIGGFSLLDRFVVGPSHDAFEGSLLAQPLGYANALGILAAMAGAACVARAATRGRAGGASLAPLAVLVPVLVLTGSRGAWIAGCAGAVGGWLLAQGRRQLAEVCALVCVTGLAVGLCVSLPGLGQRHAYWGVARASALDRPVTGTGAGSYESLYAASDLASAPARDAHSLYLETLDELGIVGLALLAGTMALPLLIAFRSGAASAPAAAAYLAFVLHAGIDWDWEMPAVTIAGLAAGVSVLIRQAASKQSTEHGRTVVVPFLAQELSGIDHERLRPVTKAAAP